MAIHPCPYPKHFLPLFAKILKKEKSQRVLDIFGGIGTLAKVKEHGFTGEVIINEIEPKWSKIAKTIADKVITGDAQQLKLSDKSVDAIVTSPTYGNDMAVTFKRERTYTIYNGKPLKKSNTGQMRWSVEGDKYRTVHKNAYKEAFRVLTDNGVIVVNVKNHIRHGKEQKVAEWHLDTLKEIGFTPVSVKKVKVTGIPFGGLNIPKVPYEHILVLRKTLDKN
jgi:hypothetical protein